MATTKKSATYLEVLKKSVMKDGFEQLNTVPVNKSRKTVQRENTREARKTKGKNWYNMPATKKTEEICRDLEILRMRSVLDPKHFYKKNDMKVIPKYFQVGRIVDSPIDFYSSRIPKKQRKKTLMDELMADDTFKQYTKRKFSHVLATNPKVKRNVLKRKREEKKRKKEYSRFHYKT